MIRSPRTGAAWVVPVLLGFAVLLLLFGPEAPPTSTDARIAFYRARSRGKATYPSYARLGEAYLQKARETGESRYYELADKALRQSLHSQRNFEAMIWLAAVELDRHRFGEALALSQEAAGALSTAPEPLGLLVDSQLALGNLKEASLLAEGMVQTHPGFAAWTRLAAVQEATGRIQEALETARRACLEGEKEPLPAQTRAWCRVRLGALSLALCDPRAAEGAYRQALELHPGYFLAKEHLAELYAAEGREPQAESLYRELLERFPSPEYRTALADLLDIQGRTAEAAREREKVVEDLRASAAGESRAGWRPLALLLLARPDTAAEGLRWAEKDWENRKAFWAAETLAWAYFKNGRCADALPAIARALAPGARTGSLLMRAAVIYANCGRPSESRSLRNEAQACAAARSPADRLLERELP